MNQFFIVKVMIQSNGRSSSQSLLGQMVGSNGQEYWSMTEADLKRDFNLDIFEIDLCFI